MSRLLTQVSASCVIVSVCLFAAVSAVDKSRWVGDLVAQQTDRPVLFSDIPMIPGTHNSASVSPRSFFSRLIWPWVQNQSLDIRTQLHMGVRFVDLRVTRNTSDDTIYCSHRFLTDVLLQDALKVIRDFLLAHPSEFILLYIRHDWSNRRELDGVHQFALWRIIEKLVGNELLRIPRLEFQSEPPFNINTPVSELQGKIVLFHDSGREFFSSQTHLPLSFGFPESSDLHQLWKGDMDQGMATFQKFFQSKTQSPHTQFSGIVIDIFTLDTRRSVANKFNGVIKSMGRPVNKNPGLVVVDYFDEAVADALFRLFLPHLGAPIKFKASWSSQEPSWTTWIWKKVSCAVRCWSWC